MPDSRFNGRWEERLESKDPRNVTFGWCVKLGYVLLQGPIVARYGRHVAEMTNKSMFTESPPGTTSECEHD